MNDLRNLEKLIKLMRKNGVASVEFNGSKVILDLHYTPPKKRKADTKSASMVGSELTSEGIEGEEEFLKMALWSAPGTLPNEN